MTKTPPPAWAADFGNPSSRIASAMETAAEPALLRPMMIPRPPSVLEEALKENPVRPWKQLSEFERPAVSRYRSDISKLEQVNCSRLAALLNAIVVLRDTKEETAMAAARELFLWTREQYPRVWRLMRGRPLPSSLQERQELAKRATREYGKVPVQWRGKWCC